MEFRPWGPIKQDFWPKINTLQRNCCILWIGLVTSWQSVGHTFSKKKTLKNWSWIKWSPKLIFLHEKKTVDFWNKKITSKLRFWHILRTWRRIDLIHKIQHFSWSTYVDSWPKILSFKTPKSWNSITLLTLV